MKIEIKRESKEKFEHFFAGKIIEIVQDKLKYCSDSRKSCSGEFFISGMKVKFEINEIGKFSKIEIESGLEQSEKKILKYFDCDLDDNYNDFTAARKMISSFVLSRS